VEKKTIRSWRSEGKIPFKRLGSSVCYQKKELDEALEKGDIRKSSSKKPKQRSKSKSA
jgi:excisionase family DNA binding protein